MRAPVVRMEAVEAIHVPEGRRALREEALPALMESIGRLGIQVPIAVRVVDEYVIAGTGEVCNVPLLVAGRHRLEAARRLKMDSVPVVEFRDEADARLWEISENLHRAELTAEERRQHVAEWVRITEEKVRTECAPLPGGAQPREGGIRKAAKALGMSEGAVRNAVKAESLPDAVKAEADALGLGTNARADIARQPDPAAELRRLKAEKEAAEAARRNKETDRAIRLTAAQEFAGWIWARDPDGPEMARILSWLEASKPKDVAAALRRLAA